MENTNKQNGHGLGVAALVVGIISFVVALIPCIGFFALFIAVVAIVLGAIGLAQAAKSNSPKGLMLGGLILGVVALFIAIIQVVFIAKLSDKASIFEEKFEDVIKEFEDDVVDELKDGNFNITIDDGDEKIEIKSSVNSELRDKLDELEDFEDAEIDANDEANININIKIDSSGSKKELE